MTWMKLMNTISMLITKYQSEWLQAKIVIYIRLMRQESTLLLGCHKKDAKSKPATIYDRLPNIY